MSKEEIEDILEELHLVRPEILDPKAKKLFEAIMSIADERDKFQQENQELKKQLEEYKEQVHKGLYNVCLPYQTGYNKAIKDKETQQKEFIKYLEDYINSLKKEYGNYVNDNYSEEYGRYYTAKEILQKYKEIIGEDK